MPTKQCWDFEVVKGEIYLEPSADDFCVFMKAFGYVAHIHDASSDDTASAFQLTIVLKLPFYYGKNASEYRHIWAFARANAFSAKANFTKGDFSYNPKMLRKMPFIPPLLLLRF